MLLCGSRARSVLACAIMARITFALWLLVAASGCSSAPAPGRPRRFRRARLSISRICDSSTIFWPSRSLRLEKVADGVTPGGYYYAANDGFTSEHGGTHIDSPVHFARAGKPSIRFRSIASWGRPL